MNTFNTSVIFLLVFSYLKSLAISEFTCTVPGSLLFHLCLFLRPKYHQFSSVAQLCLTLCDPMDRSTPGLSVHHQLHRVSDAIQPSHPLSSYGLDHPQPLVKQAVFSFGLYRMKKGSVFRLNPSCSWVALVFPWGLCQVQL